jgi:hypothetical protein
VYHIVARLGEMVRGGRTVCVPACLTCGWTGSEGTRIEAERRGAAHELVGTSRRAEAAPGAQSPSGQHGLPAEAARRSEPGERGPCGGPVPVGSRRPHLMVAPAAPPSGRGRRTGARRQVGGAAAGAVGGYVGGAGVCRPRREDGRTGAGGALGRSRE